MTYSNDWTAPAVEHGESVHHHIACYKLNYLYIIIINLEFNLVFGCMSEEDAVREFFS